MMQSESFVSRAQFGRLINRNPSYVTLLGQHDRLVEVVIDGKKMVDVAKSIERIEQSRDLSKLGVAQRHENNRVVKDSTMTSLNSDVGDDSDDSDDSASGFSLPSLETYQSAKAQHEKFKALKAEQEYRLSAGQLLVAQDVIKAVAESDVVIRSRLESLPDILAPQIAAETDAGRVKTLMVDYIEQLLMDLSSSLKRQWA